MALLEVMIAERRGFPAALTLAGSVRASGYGVTGMHAIDVTV